MIDGLKIWQGFIDLYLCSQKCETDNDQYGRCSLP